MEIWQAIVLGMVQGLTEFMPISSSAHLIIVPAIFQWKDPGLSFDVALHIGTLAATLVYFWSDLIQIAIGWVRSLRHRSLQPPHARLAWLILLGTVPAVIAGALIEPFAESVFRDIRIISVTLIALAFVLFFVERTARGTRDLTDLTWRDSLFIGVAQACALVPGVSRSGSTLTAGLFRGLKRETAARYSFLMATPITFAAVAQQMIKVARAGLPPDERAAFVAGIVASGVFGFLTIAFLLRFLRTHSTLPFVIYRVALGILLFGLVAGGLVPSAT